MNYDTINRHKVFISYYHEDDQGYKDALLDWNADYRLFEDYSVHENEIDDTGLASEQDP
ncbi:MAG: TIR domain-containing protein [Bacillus subtilis]|nr:TIR domain-containing protein [Bacillus subtilis]